MPKSKVNWVVVKRWLVKEVAGAEKLSAYPKIEASFVWIELQQRQDEKKEKKAANQKVEFYYFLIL